MEWQDCWELECGSHLGEIGVDDRLSDWMHATWLHVDEDMWGSCLCQSSTSTIVYQQLG